MVRHVWTVLCSKTATDKDSNNISLFEVVEQIQVTGPGGALAEPVLVPTSLELVSLWARADFGTPTRGTTRVVILFPDGHVAGQAEMDVDLAAVQRTRTIVKFPALPFRLPGVMRFVVSLRQDNAEEWTEVASVPLNVERLEGTQAPAPAH